MLYESSYYGIVHMDDFIVHHGVKGMKWGVRRYQNPDGSLTAAGKDRYRKNVETSEKRRAVESLSKELNEQWEYGVIHNGKRINTEEEDFDWNNYKTLPLDTLKKEKIGTCWDFVNYQHKMLNDAGIKNDSYLVMMDLSSKKEPDRIVTHTFTTFEMDGKQYWLESAMYPKRGIHEIKSFEDAAESVKSNYTSESKPYSIFKYNPDGLDKGLTGDEFIEKATENNWVKDVNVKRR